MVLPPTAGTIPPLALYRLRQCRSLRLRTDTNDRFYYLWRKYVPEGREMKNALNSDIDTPIFRYAGALLSLAEALNETGQTQEAIKYVNRVRERIPGLALLNSNEWTQVSGQDDLREPFAMNTDGSSAEKDSSTGNRFVGILGWTVRSVPTVRLSAILPS